MTIGVMERFTLFLRRSRWGGLPRSVVLMALAIVVFCVVLLPSIVFPVVGLYLAWRLPRQRKMTLYAAYIYLIAALAALWWLEMALSDRGLTTTGQGISGLFRALS